MSFAVCPKKAGRQVDVESEESWRRVGALLGRLHNAGAARKAPSRLTLSLDETTRAYVDILHGEIITPNERQTYKDICARIADVVAPYFENVENIRIHGDFHIGNILDRVDEGLMVIDFDDMMNGPAVQDMWLLLPDHYPASKPQLELLLKGYEQFREANARSMLLIEGLRAMRMVYFTHWCSMQRNDYQFKAKFPDWGSAPFWQHEIQDMRMQYSRIIESISY
jgi:Ser/Thr protein kinase RdoA (MazF antagonist)